jgi:hypothetical protein
MVELHKVGKTTFPIISGPLAQMLSERMNADFAQVHQTHNYTYSHEFPVVDPVEYWTIQLQEDYYYHLDTVQFWIPPGTDDPVNLKEFLFKVIDVGRNRELFQGPIPPRIVTTPSDQRAVRYRVKLNHTFLPESLIKVEVRYPDTTNWPDDIYSITEGIRIPRDFQIDM